MLKGGSWATGHAGDFAVSRTSGQEHRKSWQGRREKEMAQHPSGRRDYQLGRKLPSKNGMGMGMGMGMGRARETHGKVNFEHVTLLLS